MVPQTTCAHTSQAGAETKGRTMTVPQNAGSMLPNWPFHPSPCCPLYFIQKRKGSCHHAYPFIPASAQWAQLPAARYWYMNSSSKFLTTSRECQPKTTASTMPRNASAKVVMTTVKIILLFNRLLGYSIQLDSACCFPRPKHVEMHTRA